MLIVNLYFAIGVILGILMYKELRYSSEFDTFSSISASILVIFAWLPLYVTSLFIEEE